MDQTRRSQAGPKLHVSWFMSAIAMLSERKYIINTSGPRKIPCMLYTLCRRRDVAHEDFIDVQLQCGFLLLSQIEEELELYSDFISCVCINTCLCVVCLA